VLEKAEELRQNLQKFARVKVDSTDKSPGWKFAEYEMKGVPVRLEIGPKDIENNQAVLVRRDNRDKKIISLDNLEAEVKELLDIMQKELFEKALGHRNSHTYTAQNMEEFTEIVDNTPGFVKAMWCKDEACELSIKEQTGATARCMPFEQEKVSDKCVCCGKPADTLVYWGRAY